MTITGYIKKEKITFKNGYFTIPERIHPDVDNESYDRILNVNSNIIEQANMLETEVQIAMYERKCAEQNKPVEEPKPFNRRHDGTVYDIKPITPALTHKTEESEKVMREIDQTAIAEAASEDARNKYYDLIQFVENDVVVVTTEGIPDKFDVPCLGNPLEWDDEFIIKSLMVINAAKLGRYDLMESLGVYSAEKLITSDDDDDSDNEDSSEE